MTGVFVVVLLVGTVAVFWVIGGFATVWFCTNFVAARGWAGLLTAAFGKAVFGAAGGWMRPWDFATAAVGGGSALIRRCSAAACGEVAAAVLVLSMGLGFWRICIADTSIQRIDSLLVRGWVKFCAR
jgi:hypothetical protein